jgi:hypothetical protein
MKDNLPSITYDLVNNENIGYILGQLDLFVIKARIVN